MLFWWSYLQIMVQVRLSTDLRLTLRLVALTCALLFLWAPGAKAQSQSGWSVCNQTSMIIETATGRPDGPKVIVEGWRRIFPGQCRVVLNAPLTTGPHFLYGRSSRAHRSGIREWTGEYQYCVDASGSFSVDSPPDCGAMGLEPRSFKPVLIGSKTRWVTYLTETEKWTMTTARAAGIQRLLDDAGVEATKMDGYVGRRTRQAIGEFLRERKLPADTDDDQLMDILEQVAIDRARDIGLTLCNRTNNRLWTAIGRRRGEGWESRGWWALEAGACEERVIDEILLSTPHYVFAEMEADAGVKRLTAASEVFCTSRSQFAIIGRQDCGKKFYEQELFVETERPVNGKLVFEFFDRDFSFAEQPAEKGIPE